MKVEIKEKEDGFKPIKLEITIETKEEHNVLKTMSLLNVSIPELIDGAGSSGTICRYILDALHSALKNK